ncbi:MAG: Gx transporter family protein [Candidatus Izemoplasmatales bacterium]|nr:Gx transporter family protein [Candidatus Izemoplasmatales bacterium]MDD3865225.1 Gx transporter family protein [Candidatus Izemoplasmatales bacterium]
MKLRKIIILGIMVAISIVVSIVEAQISTFLFIIPGVKLGLANIVTLVVLYVFGWKDALIVLVLRIALVALLYSAMPAPLLSFAGGILAFVMMVVFKKINRFSILSVSVVGALFHMVGQIVMAIFILGTEELLYYLPYMMIISVPTGIITGLVAKRLTLVCDNMINSDKK